MQTSQFSLFQKKEVYQPTIAAKNKFKESLKIQSFFGKDFRVQIEAVGHHVKKITVDDDSKKCIVKRIQLNPYPKSQTNDHQIKPNDIDTKIKRLLTQDKYIENED